MRTMTDILSKENTMTAQIKNKEQLYEEGFRVRNAKPVGEEEPYILGRESLIFEEERFKEIINRIGVFHCILSLATIGSKQTK